MRDGIPEPTTGRRSLARAFSIEELFRALHEAPLAAGDAARIVADLRARGLVDKKGDSPEASKPFGAWLRAFWQYESTYILERLAHGQRATRRHCQDREGRAREIETSLPAGLALGEVRRSRLVELGLALKAKGLSPATVIKELRSPPQPYAGSRLTRSFRRFFFSRPSLRNRAKPRLAIAGITIHI